MADVENDSAPRFAAFITVLIILIIDLKVEAPKFIVILYLL